MIDVSYWGPRVLDPSLGGGRGGSPGNLLLKIKGKVTQEG